jgi:hypothetical protein
MSNHLNNYYGPFLLYKPSFRIEERTVRGCEKCNIERLDSRVQYCDKCGSPHTNYKKNVNQEIHISDWTKDRLYSPCEIDGNRVAIPNFNEDLADLRLIGCRVTKHGTSDSTLEVWCYQDAVTKLFRELFENEIQKLYSWSSFPSVQFGLVSYYA